MFKSGFVTIIGRPNVGKSTLTNYIMGEKLTIVSNKPQTTRNNIQTILNKEDCQIIFVDTPGVHKPKNKLGEQMVKFASDSLGEVDLVLFITSAEGEMIKSDEYILEELKKVKVPVFLLINKIDETTPEKVATTIEAYAKAFDFAEVIPMSALKGKNVEPLMEEMKKYLPEGPKYYPEDMITDKQERFIVNEIIREKALRLLNQEVPHGIAIEILSMKQSKSGTYHIDANMLCEKASHKGIIIGKNGTMLKRISQYAREDIEKFLGNKVYLRVWVKVKEDWRDSQFLLKELGYKD
ncbi:GTP-binding protein Era [Clostridium collagenovorans DSM 3089]|uniref:GTPase Era n=1 Tax=Clostridium collagenovorans DSM 3089 TaxID=1121306 RepID=A0A1M5XPU5_9CLOT|nr:GTPase Era [Clostridium collagenovorans]SHI01841.1 GTP-binding protein Era [Clostridium collagenovorans DSM 3089]